MGLVELGDVARGELFRCFLGATVSMAFAIKDNRPDRTCAMINECG